MNSRKGNSGRKSPVKGSERKEKNKKDSSFLYKTGRSRNAKPEPFRSGSASRSGGGDERYDSSCDVIPSFETVVGFHAIEEVLKEGSSEGTLFLSGRGKRHEKISALASGQHIRIQKVSDEILKRKSPDIDPRGVVLEVTGKRKSGRDTTLKSFLDRLESQEKENCLVIILDSITDPHNLGAILRSADQFNVDLVILPSRRSANDNATVRKISSGASEFVPQAVENLSRAVDQLKKKGILGLCCRYGRGGFLET